MAGFFSSVVLGFITFFLCSVFFLPSMACWGSFIFNTGWSFHADSSDVWEVSLLDYVGLVISDINKLLISLNHSFHYIFNTSNECAVWWANWDYHLNSFTDVISNSVPCPHRGSLNLDMMGIHYDPLYCFFLFCWLDYWLDFSGHFASGFLLDADLGVLYGCVGALYCLVLGCCVVWITNCFSLDPWVGAFLSVELGVLVIAFSLVGTVFGYWLFWSAVWPAGLGCLLCFVLFLWHSCDFSISLVGLLACRPGYFIIMFLVGITSILEVYWFQITTLPYYAYLISHPFLEVWFFAGMYTKLVMMSTLMMNTISFFPDYFWVPLLIHRSMFLGFLVFLVSSSLEPLGFLVSFDFCSSLSFSGLEVSLSTVRFS